MKRSVIVSSYMALFAIVAVVVFILLDAYECYAHGKFDGNLQLVKFDLTSNGEIDLTMDLTVDTWLQSRLHTMRVDVAGCTVKIDTPSGRTLEMLQATTSLPLTIKPKSLWSAWDGSTFEGRDAPTYSERRDCPLSRQFHQCGYDVDGCRRCSSDRCSSHNGSGMCG